MGLTEGETVGLGEGETKLGDGDGSASGCSRTEQLNKAPAEMHSKPTHCQKYLNVLVPLNVLLSRLWLQQWEGNHISNAGTIAQQHYKAVDPHTHSYRWRHAIFQSR